MSDFTKDVKKEKVLVAMSGGVDSSVAAFLLKQAGYEIVGATLKLWDKGDGFSDLEDARAVAEKMGAEFLAIDAEKEFKDKVINNFIESYENGLTPNPCIFCNRHMKFKALMDSAKASSATKMATGHYARTGFDEATGRYYLKKALDLSKDQSYVLYSLSQEQLARTIFPLGELSKDEVREIASSNGFVTAEKKDSQDICFIPDGDYVGFIRRCTGKAYEEGDFTDEEGNVLGRHSGMIGYTIGQRKGLGLALKKPMYVVKKDMERNRVILGDNEDLFTREFMVKDFIWVSMAPTMDEFRGEVKVRYSQLVKPATIIPMDGGRAKIIFDEPERAITPGQCAVVYKGDLVLGGGTISV